MRKFMFALLGIATLVVSTLTMATLTQSTAQATNCVDISNFSNMEITWPNRDTEPGTVHIKTKQALPVCKDKTLWFSAYTLPQNYDNSGNFGFDHPTSFPQASFAHTRIDVKAGRVLNATYTVAEADLCKSAAQYDVYSRTHKIDEILTGNGIREYKDIDWAKGVVIKRDLSDRCTPEVPVTPVTPETPETPETPPAPVELPKTGVETPLLYALLIGSLTYGAVYLARRG